MRRLIAIWVMILAVCTMAWAGAAQKPMTGEEMLQAKRLQQADLEHVLAAKAAGTLDLNDPAYLRLLEQETSLSAPRVGSLDQGGDACATATVISSLPYNTTGVLDGDDDVTDRPYYDVFYTYTVQADGNHTFDMCGSAGDTYLRVWYSGVCGDGFSQSSDDICGMAPNMTLFLTAGTVIYIECGRFGDYECAGTEYYFNMSGPSLTLGRCCYGDAMCAVTTAGECTALGGNWVEGMDCSTPCPSCADFALTAPGTINGSTCNAGDDCNLRAGTDQTVAVTIPTAGVWTFTLCNSPVVWDVTMYISETCCGSSIYYNDDSQCGANWTVLPTISCVELAAGTYFVDIEPYSSWNCNEYVLSVTECTPPTGRCCYGDPMNPMCGMTTAAECEGLGGMWDMYSTCETPCPATGRCCYGSPMEPYCVTVSESRCYGEFAGSWTAGVSCETAPCEAFVCDGHEPMEGRFCNEDGGTIQDVTVNSFVIHVPEQYHITDVNVSWDAVHTYDGDVQIRLMAPDGTTAILINRRGGGADNWFCTTMDDEAETPVSAGLPPYAGSWIPDEALAVFDDRNAYGDWVLTFDDQVGGDYGWLNWACLTIDWDYTLDVELASYAAVAGNGQVTLNWATASETDNDHFDVVRDGRTVASIEANGSASGATYTWTDATVQNGTTYRYTLVAVDVNGVRTEQGTVEATPNLGAGQVTEYALYQNYPNPFNPSTQIAFDMVEAGFVTLKVYNLVGQEVATVVNGNLAAGRHAVSFDATDLPSGAYLYRIEANGFSAVQKMLLMK